MNLRAVARQVREVVGFHGVGAGVQLLGLAAVRRQFCLERALFFELARRPRQPMTAGRHTRLATAADIVQMSTEPLWQMSDLGAADVDGLLGAGHRCVLNLVDGRIAGYAWMNPNRIVVPKLRLAIPLSGEMVHVYKGFTHPEFRGQRIGGDRFAHWYDHLTEARGISVVVDFAFDNPSTLARAERSGLRRIGSGTYLRRGRFERLWMTGALAGRARSRIAADIPHRDH